MVATTHPDNEVLRHGSKTADGVVVSTLAADVAASAEKLRFSDLEILAESAGTAPHQAVVAFRYKVRHTLARCTPLCDATLAPQHAQVQVVGQKGFGGRPSAREQARGEAGPACASTRRAAALC